MRRAVSSVLTQGWPALELLVVDDHSADDTNAVVRGLGPSVRYLATRRASGAQAARNVGIRAASGSWIAFLDSDDEWLAGKLWRQVHVLRARNFDPWTVVHGNCCRVEDGATPQLWELPLVEGKDAYRSLLAGPGPAFPAILASKLAMESIGLLDEKVPSYQEWDTTLRLARVCDFVHLREPLFLYHIHSAPRISDSIVRDIRGYHYVLLKHRQEIERLRGRSHYAAQVVWNLERAADLGHFALGAELLKRSGLPFHTAMRFWATLQRRQLLGRLQRSEKADPT